MRYILKERNKASALRYWVEDVIGLEEWQLKELEAGIKEANDGVFASEDEVNKVLTKWLKYPKAKFSK